MSNLYRGPSIDASYQVSYHLAKRLQRKSCFRNRPIRNKNCLWQQCLLMVRDKMSNFIENLPYMLPTKFQFIWQSGLRGEDFQKSTNQKQELPVAAIFVNGTGRNEQSLQRTFHRCILPSFGSIWQSGFRGEFFLEINQSEKKNCLWWPCLLSDRDRMSNLQRTFQGCFLPSFGSFDQAVSEEKIFQKSANQRQELPVVAMFVNGLGQNEHSLQRTFHRCFLPSFSSFV